MSDEFKCQFCNAPLPAYVADQECPECGSSLDLPDNNPANGLTSDSERRSAAPASSAASQLDQRISKRIKKRATKPAAISERDFGEYRLIDEMDRGPMGQIYKAKHSSSGDLVALKVIDAEHLQTELEMDRFAIEAAACVALDHPGIVPVLEFGKIDSQQFVSMEYVDGLNLGEVLEDGPLSNEDALEMIERIVSAVRFAHERGVIHRNLKPANILVVEKTGWSKDEPLSSVRVTDFGLARQTDRQAHANVHDTDQHASVSTYIAPEQIIEDWDPSKTRGRNQGVGTAVDIYSIGALLYAMLTGRGPHELPNDVDRRSAKASSVETLSKIISREPTPIRQLCADVNPDLEAICLKCLELDPQQRFASAEALLDEISRVADDQPIETRPLGLVERFRRWQGLILGATLKSGDQQKRDVRLRTAKSMMGLPLIDVAYGQDRLAAITGPTKAEMMAEEFRDDVDMLDQDDQPFDARGKARGIFAFGDQAVGVVAVGNRAYGLIAIGRRAFGAIAIGWTSVGIISFGFLSLGVYAIGGLSIGYHATGLIALGYYAWGALISLGWQATGYWSWSMGGELPADGTDLPSDTIEGLEDFDLD